MSDLKNNTLVLIVIAISVLLLGVLGGGYYAYTALFSTPEEPVTDDRQRRRRIVAPVNEIPVGERPYVSIEPLPASRELAIVVHALNKPADVGEYEIEYQSGSQIQGAVGSLDIGETPSRTEILLGSCSAGGACTYHEDVSGGSLKLSFSGAEEYALKQDWNYIENTANSNSFSSRDDSFSITGEALTNISHAIIYQSPGLPESLDGELVTEAFAVRYDSEPLGEELLVAFEAASEASTIYGWDGETWQPFEVTMQNGAATASVPALELYVATK